MLKAQPMTYRGFLIFSLLFASFFFGDELALDRYEGCPQFYYKTEMYLPIKGIKSKKIRIRKAYVYIMHEDRELGIPSQHYLGTCLEGYLRFGFNPDYLVDALNKSKSGRIEDEEGIE